jgi:hypothetical protein
VAARPCRGCEPDRRSGYAAWPLVRREGRVHPVGAVTRPAAQQAPGVVKVCLAGERADMEAVAAVLAGICDVLDRSEPRPNRYDPGERIYLTIRTGPANPAGPLHRT